MKIVGQADILLPLGEKQCRQTFYISSDCKSNIFGM